MSAEKRKERNERRMEVYLTDKWGLTLAEIDQHCELLKRNRNDLVNMLLKQSIERSRSVNG